MTPGSIPGRAVPTLLLVAALLASTAAGGVAATGAVTTSDGVDPITDHSGDVVRITINVSSYGGGTVDITGQDVDYDASLSVSDGDGDGTVVLLFNTHKPGVKKTFDTVSERDAASFYSQTRVDGLLPPGDYAVSVAPKDAPSYEQTVTIEPRSTEGASLFVAPAGSDQHLTSVDAIEDARDAGNLTSLSSESGTPPVAKGDVLVFHLEASGLEGALDHQPGDDLSEQFVRLTDGPSASLEFRETHSSPERYAATLLWNATNTDVVVDHAGNGYYLVVDLDGIQVSRDPDEDEDLEPLPPGSVMGANFTVDGDDVLAPSDEPASAGPFEVAERELSPRFDSLRESGAFYLSPAANRTVGWETSLAPGSTVTVRLATDDDSIERERTVRVAANRTVQATFDLRDVPEGTPLNAGVVDASGDLVDDPETVRVVPLRAGVDVRGQSAADGQLRTTVVSNLSRGGLVVVRTADGERTLGATAVERGPTFATVNVSDPPAVGTELVAVAYRDLDDDGQFSAADRPYEQDGQPVSAALSVETTPEPGTPATPDTPTATPDTPSTGTPASGTPTDSPTVTPSETPGGTDGTPDPLPGVPDVPGTGLVPSVPGVSRTVELGGAAGVVLVATLGLFGFLRR